MGSKNVNSTLDKIRNVLEYHTIFTSVQKTLICLVFLLVLGLAAGVWLPIVAYIFCCAFAYILTVQINSHEGDDFSVSAKFPVFDKQETLLKLQNVQDHLYRFFYGKHVEKKRTDFNASDSEKFARGYGLLHSQFRDHSRTGDSDEFGAQNDEDIIAIDSEIKKITALVLKDFVLSWYQQISFGNYGAENGQKIIEDVTKTAYARIGAIDTHELVNKCAELYKCHLKEFQDALKTLNRQPNYRRRDSLPDSGEFKKVKSIEEVYEKDLTFHGALRSSEKESECLCAIVDILLQNLLSGDLYSCMTGKDIFSEVLVHNLVTPLLDLLCKPDFLHEKLVQILADNEDALTKELDEIISKLTVYTDGAIDLGDIEKRGGDTDWKSQELSGAKTLPVSGKPETSQKIQLKTEMVVPSRDKSPNLRKVPSSENVIKEVTLTVTGRKSSDSENNEGDVKGGLISGDRRRSSDSSLKGVEKLGLRRYSGEFGKDDLKYFERRGSDQISRKDSQESVGKSVVKQLNFPGDVSNEQVRTEQIEKRPVLKPLESGQPSEVAKNVDGNARRASGDREFSTRKSVLSSVEVLSESKINSSPPPKSGEECTFFTDDLAKYFNIAPGASGKGVPAKTTEVETATLGRNVPKQTSKTETLAPVSMQIQSLRKDRGMHKIKSLPQDLNKMDHQGERRRRQSQSSLPDELLLRDHSPKTCSTPEKTSTFTSSSSSFAEINLFEVYQDPVSGEVCVRERRTSRVDSQFSTLPSLTEEVIPDDDAMNYETRLYRGMSNASEFLVISAASETESGSLTESSLKDADSEISRRGTDATDSTMSVSEAETDFSLNSSVMLNEAELSQILFPDLKNRSLESATNVASRDTIFGQNVVPNLKSSPNLPQNAHRDSNPTPPGSTTSMQSNNLNMLNSWSGPGDIGTPLEDQASVFSESDSTSAWQNFGSWDRASDESFGSSPSVVNHEGDHMMWQQSLYSSMHIPRTEFIQERGHGSFVVYEVEYFATQCPVGSSELQLVQKSVKRRFKEFVILQERLEDHHSLRHYLKGIKAPSKWFSLPIAKFDKDAIEKRRKFLEEYLSALLEREPIAYSGDLREFLAYDGDANLAFVKKATEIPVNWIDKVFHKTKSGVSEVIDKIDRTLTSHPPQTLEEVVDPNVVKKPVGAKKKVVDYDKLPTEDVDALRVQFAVTSESQRIQLGLERHLSAQLLISPDSYGVEMTEDHHFSSDDDFHDAWEDEEDAERIREEGRVGRGPLYANPLSHSILDLACQTSNGREIWFCQEKILRSFQAIVGTFFERWVRNEINDITSTRSITKYLRLLREVVWPDKPFDLLQKTEEDKDRTKELARQCLKEFFPVLIPILVGEDNFDFCVDQALNSIQHPKINRHFFLCLIDLLVEEFLPEISIHGVQERILNTRCRR